MAASSSPWTGGCFCGRVRYAATTPPSGASYCHCRMCQRATGNAFAAFVSFPADAFAWTAGEPRTFRSSTFACRGFCPDCGTPLMMVYDRRPQSIGVTLGSLDHPERVAPDRHWGAEAMMPWLHIADGLPRVRTEDDPEFAHLSGKQ